MHRADANAGLLGGPFKRCARLQTGTSATTPGNVMTALEVGIGNPRPWVAGVPGWGYHGCEGAGLAGCEGAGLARIVFGA